MQPDEDYPIDFDLDEIYNDDLETEPETDEPY